MASLLLEITALRQLLEEVGCCAMQSCAMLWSCATSRALRHQETAAAERPHRESREQRLAPGAPGAPLGVPMVAQVPPQAPQMDRLRARDREAKYGVIRNLIVMISRWFRDLNCSHSVPCLFPCSHRETRHGTSWGCSQ